MFSSETVFEVKMHDLFVALGRTLAKEHKPLILLDLKISPDATLEAALEESQIDPSDTLEWLVVRGRCTTLRADTLDKCVNLKMLHISGGVYIDGECQTIPGKLQSLQIIDRWMVDPVMSTPWPLGQLKQLTHLRLHRVRLQDDKSKDELDFRHLKLLRSAEFVHCELRKLPPSFFTLHCLRRLTLMDHHLQELPRGIGQIKALRELNLLVPHCKLPDDVGDLTSLRLLWVEVQSLPRSFEKLTNLRALTVESSSQELLPSGFAELRSLECMKLLSCQNLQSLTTGFGAGLTSLKELILYNCTSLTELPPCIGLLSSLQSLDLSVITSLRELPPGIGLLPSLRSLDLQGCTSLRELPAEISQLSSLETLQLKSCHSLQSLPTGFGPGLTSLKELILQDCTSLTELPPGIGQLSSLQRLDLQRCTSLRELPAEIGQLSSLKTLNLWRCPGLNEELPLEIHLLHSLKVLR